MFFAFQEDLSRTCWAQGRNGSIHLLTLESRRMIPSHIQIRGSGALLSFLAAVLEEKLCSMRIWKEQEMLLACIATIEAKHPQSRNEEPFPAVLRYMIPVPEPIYPILAPTNKESERVIGEMGEDLPHRVNRVFPADLFRAGGKAGTRRMRHLRICARRMNGERR
jgi:hypothetical protein